MIGGKDTMIPYSNDAADALRACARTILAHWPKARFENVITGEKYNLAADVPFDRVQELVVFPDAESESAWDADKLDAPENSMLYLIVSDVAVTVVSDNPDASEIRLLLAAIRHALRGKEPASTVKTAS